VIVSFDTVHARIRVVEDANNSSTADAGERVYWRSLEGGARFAVPPVGISASGTTAVEGPGWRRSRACPASSSVVMVRRART
jgi:hypothetical protein